jgi:hypothetical protein
MLLAALIQTQPRAQARVNYTTRAFREKPVRASSRPRRSTNVALVGELELLRLANVLDEGDFDSIPIIVEASRRAIDEST